MSITSERLYELLPVIVRQRDAERGGPLQALCSVLAREGQVFEDDLQRLYDNLFIETCDEWVVPYLGDLLGVRGVNDIAEIGFSQRARVANTLGYRRRKGTAAMLEQLALDTTGWRARAVEFFERLAATQWLNHLRLDSFQTPDLRRGEALERIGTAFEETRHFVDVRRIAAGRGRYNIPNLGLFLWRLQSDYLRNRGARPAPDGGVVAAQGRFFVHALGIDAPLFNRPQTETEITTLATEHNVPGRLRRRPLDAEAESMRRALADGGVALGSWFGREPVFEVSFRLKAADPLTAVKPEEMVLADLDAPSPAVPEVWLRPPDKLTYTRESDGTTVDLPIKVAVDPVLGRLAFPAGVVPVEVRVSAGLGFPGDTGGGAYDRRETTAQFPLAQVTWQAGVGRDLAADAANRLFNKFEDAIAAWNAAPAGTVGLIAVVDNLSYFHGGVTLQLAAGSKLLVVSADWPESPQPGGGKQRQPGRITPTESRAHLVGDVTVRSAPGSELWIDGLLMEGHLGLSNTGGAGLARLRLAHTTLPPGWSDLTIGNAHGSLALELYRTVCGPIDLSAPALALRIDQSAVDGGTTFAVSAPQTPAEINGSTVVGTTEVQQLSASDTIFTDLVTVARRQTGCVRFCFVPVGSTTPRRYRCQPDLALAEATTAEEEQAVLDRMVPDFTDDHYGGPAYLQLTRACPDEIRTGAEDGSEMGVWWPLRQPQREANLLTSLDEFLRLGLEAGLIFVT